jgi:hypothetical protein
MHPLALSINFIPCKKKSEQKYLNKKRIKQKKGENELLLK